MFFLNRYFISELPYSVEWTVKQLMQKKPCIEIGILIFDCIIFTFYSGLNEDS